MRLQVRYICGCSGASRGVTPGDSFDSLEVKEPRGLHKHTRCTQAATWLMPKEPKFGLSSVLQPLNYGEGER